MPLLPFNPLIGRFAGASVRRRRMPEGPGDGTYDNDRVAEGIIASVCQHGQQGPHEAWVLLIGDHDTPCAGHELQ